MICNVREGKFERACADLKQLYEIGYSPIDIITSLYDALQNYEMPDFLKLEFLKVWLIMLLFCACLKAYFPVVGSRHD